MNVEDFETVLNHMDDLISPQEMQRGHRFIYHRFIYQMKDLFGVN